MEGQESWSAWDYGLALLIALKGHDAARTLRREARSVRRGGVRYKALRGSARAMDRAAESPVETVNALRRVWQEYQSRR